MASADTEETTGRTDLHKVERLSLKPGVNRCRGKTCKDSEYITLTKRLAAAEAANARLRDQIAEARLLLSSVIDYAIVTFDMNGDVTSWSVGAEALTGYAESEVAGLPGEAVFKTGNAAERQFTVALCQAIETGRAVNEGWYHRRDGSRFWASGSTVPLLQDAAGAQGFATIFCDRTEERAEAERRELLMFEMNHRMKNLLAVVQALAAQTDRHTATSDEFRQAFGDRLVMLARSNDVLVRRGWQEVPLIEVIESALAHCAGEQKHIMLNGDSVLLPANNVTALSLVFHELATNAMKHGALRVPGGRVTVDWALQPAVDGKAQVEIVWREHGGPSVEDPQRRGFGSQLIERGLSTGGTARLDFQRDGVECRIELPLHDDLPDRRDGPPGSHTVHSRE